MEKYGVFEVCPECKAQMKIDMIKLGDGTQQETCKCPECNYEGNRVVNNGSSPSADE